MTPSKKAHARLSLYAEMLPMAEGQEGQTIRAIRKKYRRPYRITRTADGLRIYKWHTYFDCCTVVIGECHDEARLSKIGTRF